MEQDHGDGVVVSKEPAILLNFSTKLYDRKEEDRIAHKQAKVRLENGDLFSWDKIRKEFSQRRVTKVSKL